MPYIPLQLGAHIPVHLRHWVKEIVEPFLSEYHFLLTCHEPDQGPKGSLQRSLAVLILSAIDGAAQLFLPTPGKKRGATAFRFKSFVLNYFPWRLDPPEGCPKEEATDLLYYDARCSIIHRFGAHSDDLNMKYGRSHSLDDSAVETLETLFHDRPSSEPTISVNPERIGVWVDGLYWCLRLAIIDAFSTPERCMAIQQWILSGEWDEKRKGRFLN